MNDTKIGVITSGIPYQYVKEALTEASVLKLGMVNPLPRKLIEDFASKVDTLYIVEELDPVNETQAKILGIKAIGKEIFTVQGEYSANMIRQAILKEDLEISKPRGTWKTTDLMSWMSTQRCVLCTEQVKDPCSR